jgi:hypothetical protein
MIGNAETELEIIMAESEPTKKCSPQKCGNLGKERHPARKCTKGGSTHVRRDTLPASTLKDDRGRDGRVPGFAGAHQVNIVKA